MLTFLGEWFHWLSLSWRRRKKLGRPSTSMELLNEPYKLSKSEFMPERYQMVADAVESGRYAVDDPVEVFPWDRRRADDE